VLIIHDSEVVVSRCECFSEFQVELDSAYVPELFSKPKEVVEDCCFIVSLLVEYRLDLEIYCLVRLVVQIMAQYFAPNWFSSSYLILLAGQNFV